MERAELIARLSSGDARHFASATFELLLHEYLKRLGFQLTPHPELPNGRATRPDFLVTCPDGQSMYLEAVCASDDTGRDIAAEARKAVALQMLDSAAHSDFMVSIESEGDPTTQPSGRRLAGEVIRWLNTLDPDALLERAARDGHEALPEMTWQHEEWRVRVRPVPVRPEARGRPRRLIGARSFGAGWIDGWTPIRDAVLSKARRYGELDLPLVVAVNVDSFRLDPIDEAQALFGQEQLVVAVGGERTEPRLERARNGAWRGPSGPRGRQCSGAWLFDNLSPYTLAWRRQKLYLNPWAHRSVPDAFLLMPHAAVVDDRIESIDGRSFREVFGLPEQWPE
ncbi:MULTISPECIES: hypothetical protein [Variovorax]|uniref:hypothetical protein n=1 Tax=Variovorax TaxID=34072 RepID=UPI00285F2B3A|nr:hypothetical protein [Variovorax sp. 3319]MDR6890386.1 hypothetical protein [Variovorax sp. 3319]